jgi:hypothetical protein
MKYYGMNQVQIAWIKAVEKKLGTEVNAKAANDVRLLARLATGTNGSVALADGNSEG